ncbi:hypothetical protein C8F04DRAFT_1130239 [Mycena alexandri]|uniref:Uncharacterized protein n=1 Tax=Mycena alexandri TaxID=1745969 RepID=A0AAD6SG98_9AGAR|nr:hypothetical protein C8F04DRAFT_1130239 [Mycena alexandri]
MRHWSRPSPPDASKLGFLPHRITQQNPPIKPKQDQIAPSPGRHLCRPNSLFSCPPNQSFLVTPHSLTQHNPAPLPPQTHTHRNGQHLARHGGNSPRQRLPSPQRPGDSLRGLVCFSCLFFIYQFDITERSLPCFSVRVPPGTTDAILLVENDVIVHLPTTLQARQSFGWAEPAVRIIVRVNGVNRARCLVGVPTGVFGPDTILVRTLDEFRAVLN